jgi:hypothetical protein
MDVSESPARKTQPQELGPSNPGSAREDSDAASRFSSVAAYFTVTVCGLSWPPGPRAHNCWFSGEVFRETVPSGSLLDRAADKVVRVLVSAPPVCLRQGEGSAAWGVFLTLLLPSAASISTPS